MRALITGGAGFIGSHLAERLLAEGHHVAVLDDLSTGAAENIEHLAGHSRFQSTIGSVTNEATVARMVDRADVVFHLAATLGVRLVCEQPVRTIETNVTGTGTVLRQASRRRKLVLVASTSEVYGKGNALPFREDADLVLGSPVKTRWGYATSKLLDEFLALAYWKEQQSPVIVMRFFNTVGPRQSSQYGMVLPNFVRRALEGAPMTVHGDGTQTRSFTWVGDVVSAMLKLMDEPAAVGEVFNIGHGAEISIRDLAYKVKKIARSDSPIQFVPYSQLFDEGFEDMARRVPDISKIGRVVGYTPTVHLDEIIGNVVEYWKAKQTREAAGARGTSKAQKPRASQRLSAMPITA